MNIDKGVFDELKKTHTQVSEELILLKRSLDYVCDQAAFDNVGKVMKFFEDNLADHFAMEEKHIFSVVLAMGELEYKQVVRELQQEHIVMHSRLDEVKDIVLKHGFSFKDEKTKDRFIGLSKIILELLIMHARKEDEKLFPYVIKKGYITD